MRKIGIPINLMNLTCGIGTSYFHYLTEMFEKVEIVFLSPLHVIKDLDLLFLPGGADINPVRYGFYPTVSQGYSNPYQEYFDTMYLPEYIERETPIFGVN